MQIIQARENEMFFKQCLGQFDLKETYLFESVGFEQIHIRTFFPSLLIMISRSGYHLFP